MTRLPQLEQELVAAAARLQCPRRVVAPAMRVAIVAASTGLAVLAIALLVSGSSGEGGGAPAREAAQQGAATPGAPLEEVLGIFREPATAEDEMGQADPVAERKPGEDPSQSRRVDWPGQAIFMWPMQDGVCHSLLAGRGCASLDQLRDVGLSVWIDSLGKRTTVSGPVADGIDEVVLEDGPGGAEVSVPVRDNFFFVDLKEEIVERLTWTYEGERQSLEIGDMIRVESVVEPGPKPDGPDPQANAPDARVTAIPGSESDRHAFDVFGTSYTAVGFHSTQGTVCMRLDTAAGRSQGYACRTTRGLADKLAEQPGILFATGGTEQHVTVHKGFARSDVVEITPRDPSSNVEVVLSDPWRPGPWEGDPLRFVLVFDRDARPQGPPPLPYPELEARLEDGTVIPLTAP